MAPELSERPVLASHYLSNFLISPAWYSEPHPCLFLPVELEAASSLADGIAVKRVGDLTYNIVEKYVDEVVSVDEEEIAHAILLLLEIEKIVVEGAGAVTLAALVNRKVSLEGKKVLSVISGGNIDVNILSRIISRGLSVDRRIVQVRMRIRDVPGALKDALEICSDLGTNIIDIIHHRFEPSIAFGYMDVTLILEIGVKQL